MDSTVVVKVKCGDTLRRFNVSVGGDDKFGMKFEQLKEKMRDLFKLTDQDDFTITYTDSDGDSVTLVEDCDLDDVVLQRLNPVRMVLTLRSVGSRASFDERKSTPVDSPRINQSIDSIHAGVENVVKTVPEPFRGLLLKITSDLAATASAPVIADIIHAAGKIGESFAAEGSQSFSQKEASTEIKTEKKKETADSETSSVLPGLKTNSDAEVKAKEVDSRACRVPDLNHAPPPTSGFAATAGFPNTSSHNYGKRDTHCPMFGNGGYLNVDVKPYNGCPFSKTSKTRPDLRPYSSFKGDDSTQFKRSHSHSDSMGPVSHTGVQCDGCYVRPIIGPRFKSKVRYNYDLCSLCYEKSGNKADYVRIDSPMLYHHIMKALHLKRGGLGQRFKAYGQFKPVAEHYNPFTGNPVPFVNQVKLDSRFIMDVNVMDGTIMAPSTPFTKIWRMKNTGNVVWPVGTQLVSTEGDDFSVALSVDLEIPATGVPVEGEIDVAVDFVAPELSGVYVSYWRMSSASGQKFGQSVWVAIQVDASPEALIGSFNHLNLNVPSQRNDLNNPVVIDINIEPPVNNTFSPSNPSPAEIPVTVSEVSSKVVDLQGATETPLAFEPLPEAVTTKIHMEEKGQDQEARGASSETKGSVINEQDLNFPINDFLLVGDAFSNGTGTPPPSAPFVSYPVVDSSKIESEPMPVIASSNVEHAETFNETEESLLKQLSEMGFNQVDLNREILRKNAYEMEKTVVDLWDISEWDPIMDELEEMGFSDKKKNAILLVKNKGSIKRVVMDLVAGDQSQ